MRERASAGCGPASEEETRRQQAIKTGRENAQNNAGKVTPVIANPPHQTHGLAIERPAENL